MDSRAAPRIVRFLLGSATLLLAAYAAHALFNLGGNGSDDLFLKWINDIIVVECALACIWRGCSSRENRWPWVLVGIGMASWAAGNIWYSLFLVDVDPLPVPSIADGLWLGIYPPVYLAVVLLARDRIRGLGFGIWLDGLLAFFAVAGLSTQFVIQPVMNAAAGQGPWTVATNLAYPIGDLVMLGIVLVVLTLSGWRAGRVWLLMGAGFLAFTVTDGLFLAKTADGTYTVGTIIDAGWLLAALLLAASAWTPVPRGRVRELTGASTLFVPLFAALLAIAELAAVALGSLNVGTLVLSIGALLTVVVRMAISITENHSMLRSTRREAATDALTGLGNRRKLLTDLSEVVAGHGDPVALVLYDLDGFKTYNDTFGHPAGDSLLARIARALGDALPTDGRAYRMGGDEFCVLIPLEGRLDAESIAGRLAAAAHQHGEGFEVGASYGVAVIDGTLDEIEALRLADTRMYAAKKGGRRAPARQTADALLAIVHERHPDVARHGDDVAELAISVGRRLGLAECDLSQLDDAARLHDIGKMAIPDAILDKPDPLNDDEWEFMSRHTIIGERILAAAPSLSDVAQVVRASHERWDGGGYPDGTASDDIPLAARIVFACDAFNAMTTVRPYQKHCRTHDEAISELERCAGSQFDPSVVPALTDFLREQKTRAVQPVGAAA